MTREEKLMKVHALLAEVSDVLVDRFFDADTTVFFRYVLRERIVVGRKSLRHGRSQEDNRLSF